MSETDPESKTVVQARDEVIEAMTRATEVWGIKGSYGRLYGILYFEDEPLSLDRITERSDYAKSTVSTTLSTLERYHFVHRRSIPGEGKKAYYEAERDLWHVFQQFLDQEIRSEIRIMTRALDDAAERLENADSERARRDREKIERLRNLYKRAETFTDLSSSSSVDRIRQLIRRFHSDAGE